MTHIRNAEEMTIAASELVARMRPGDRATVVTLSGELGAGKTTFAQGVAAALGVEETVTSPTFVIEKIYQLQELLEEKEKMIESQKVLIEELNAELQKVKS